MLPLRSGDDWRGCEPRGRAAGERSASAALERKSTSLKADTTSAAAFSSSTMHDSLIAGKRFRILSREEEIDAWRKMREGDDHAREQLVESQLAWVRRIAVTMQRHGEELEDLFQIGVVALLESIEVFDARRARLTTFVARPVSWRIRGHQNKATLVTRPANRNPRNAEAWDRAGHVPHVLQHEFLVVDDDNNVDRDDELQLVRSLIDELGERERTVLERRMAGEALHIIGHDMALSKERVRQIESLAIRQLRERLAS